MNIVFLSSMGKIEWTRYKFKNKNVTLCPVHEKSYFVINLWYKQGLGTGILNKIKRRNSLSVLKLDRLTKERVGLFPAYRLTNS